MDSRSSGKERTNNGLLRADFNVCFELKDETVNGEEEALPVLSIPSSVWVPYIGSHTVFSAYLTICDPASPSEG